MFLQMLNDVSNLTYTWQSFEQHKKLQLGPCSICNSWAASCIVNFNWRDVHRCSRPFSKGKLDDKSKFFGTAARRDFSRISRRTESEFIPGVQQSGLEKCKYPECWIPAQQVVLLDEEGEGHLDLLGTQLGQDTAWSHACCCNTWCCPEQHYQRRFVFCFSYSQIIYINYQGDNKHNSTKFHLDGGLVQPDLVADWADGNPAYSRRLEMGDLWGLFQPTTFYDSLNLRA